MTTTCTKCQGTGFLNTHQLPGDLFDGVDDELVAVEKWIADNTNHNVQVCDCCGNGKEWYGHPGEHYGPEDITGGKQRTTPSVSDMSDRELLKHATPITELETELYKRLLSAVEVHDRILECLKKINTSINRDPLGLTKRQAY